MTLNPRWMTLVVPARAGVILYAWVVLSEGAGCSRASGGDPSYDLDMAYGEELFPRERG